jgi:hypothetical protein
MRSTIQLRLESLEDRTLLSATADIQMLGATTTDSRTISVSYDITGADLTGQALNFNIYRSANYNSLAGAQLIGMALVPASDSTDLSVGRHQGVKLALAGTNGRTLTALTPNTALPFVVVVAIPGPAIQASNTANNTASFETHTLGVIVHGIEFNFFRPTTPAWETQMATALQQVDHYEAVIPFNWVQGSLMPFPGQTTKAASQLTQQVLAEVNQLAAQHPGDVVDVNFIGHSRGDVVISQALQDLEGVNDPTFHGGFIQMTMLDPHPANNLFGPLNWNPNNLLADYIAALAFIFQAIVQDPQVIVPPDVTQAEVFDQQTPSGQHFAAPVEQFLNLWGEGPTALPNQSGQPIPSQNLTGVIAPGIGLIGHDEVHDWYMANVVDTNKTFTYFG